MNHYPRHIGDWRTATYNLTRQQRSIYSDLIDHYYDKEQPIPADFDRLAKDQGCLTAQEQADLRYILDRYFTLDGDVYRNERCDEEIAHFHHIVEVGRKAGKASASARAERKGNGRSTVVDAFSADSVAGRQQDKKVVGHGLQKDDLGNGRSSSVAENSVFSQRLGNALPTTGQPPNTQYPTISNTGSGSSRDRAQAASPPAPAEPPHADDGNPVITPAPVQEPPPAPPRRPSKKCPKDFEVTGPMLQWAMVELGLEEVVIKRETDKMRDHTFGRTITDWVGAWRNWMRKAADFSNHRSHQKGGIGAVLDRKAKTDNFRAAITGANNAASEQSTFDVESRVVRDGEELPVEPRD